MLVAQFGCLGWRWKTHLHAVIAATQLLVLVLQLLAFQAHQVQLLLGFRKGALQLTDSLVLAFELVP